MPPVLFLKLPPKKDESWKVDSKVGGEAVTGTFKETALDANQRPGFLIRTPNCSDGRSSAPQDSHSTAKADENRAPQLGHCERISPLHWGQAAGSSGSNSSK